MDSGISDEAYQEQILPHVSRTFALTIPQLPAALRLAVTNAYLLCRIADTIEDEPALSPAETLAFLERFKAVVAGHGEAAATGLARSTGGLSERTLPTERDLVSQHGARPQRDRILDRAAAGGDSALRRPHVLRNAAISIDGQPARPRPQHRPRRLLLLRRRRGRRDADGAVLRVLRGCSARIGPNCSALPSPSRRAADDEYSQGCVGGSQPRRLLAAAGSLHAPMAWIWRGSRRSRAIHASMPGCAS